MISDMGIIKLIRGHRHFLMTKTSETFVYIQHGTWKETVKPIVHQDRVGGRVGN